AAPRRAPERDAAARGPQVAATMGGDGLLQRRLRLLEGFIGRTEAADCATYALRWLDEALGIDRALCLVKSVGEPTMRSIATHGSFGAGASPYTLSLDDWNNPLISALSHRKPAFFPPPHSAADRRRRPSTPFEDAAFHALPLGVSGFTEDPSGLLLVGGAAP